MQETSKITLVEISVGIAVILFGVAAVFMDVSLIRESLNPKHSPLPDRYISTCMVRIDGEEPYIILAVNRTDGQDLKCAADNSMYNIPVYDVTVRK